MFPLEMCDLNCDRSEVVALLISFDTHTSTSRLKLPFHAQVT